MPSKKGSNFKEIVRFEYQFDPEFREYYVTEARGRIQNIYHLRLDFYVEKVKLKFLQDKLVQYDDGRREVLPIDLIVEPDFIERTLKVGLNKSFNAVRILARFLNEKVKEIEIIEKKLSEEIKHEGIMDNDS